MRSKGCGGIGPNFSKDNRVLGCLRGGGGRKRRGTNVAVAIFSSGAIVSWLGENGKGGGLANPSSVSKPFQSAQLLSHADLQEDALSFHPPLDTHTHTAA